MQLHLPYHIQTSIAYGNKEIGIVLGITSITIACIYIAMIDRWKERRKKEELDTIEDYINRKAEEIANMKVLRKLEELEEE